MNFIRGGEQTRWKKEQKKRLELLRRRLDLRELIDGLKSRYYVMEEAVADLAPSQADRIMSW
jgi:hypothetical protein